MIYALQVSGGKDSAAMWAWAKRTKLAPRVAMTCNTGWEADFAGARWREYVIALAVAIGEPLRILEAPTLFAQRVEKYATFPGRQRRRWCTEELKLEPAKAEIDRLRAETGEDVTVVVGVRAEESAERSKMPEREWSDFYDCEVWRPLLSWTVEDVIREHHAAGIPLNPLYHLGAERVGCWPCIKAGKRELEMVARLDPGRIEEIRQLEAKTGNLMFCIERSRRGGGERKLIPVPIDEAIAWARTSRGGYQLAIYPEPSGCARWGICEPPSRALTAADDGGEERHGEG